MSHTVEFPSEETGLTLHLRLGDPDDLLASADLCTTYLDPLLAWLAKAFPQVDADQRQSAAHDALFSYVQRPGAWCPERGELGAYLRMSAKGDLNNLLRGEKQGTGKKIPWEFVEPGPEGGNLIGREKDPCEQLEREEEAMAGRMVLEDFCKSLPPEEQAALELLLQGERRTQAYVPKLGLDSLPTEEQEIEVKRWKDRIKKRLVRGGRTHE
jgi:hypothetical protein